MSAGLTRRGFLAAAATGAAAACTQIPTHRVPKGAPGWPVRVPLATLSKDMGVAIVERADGDLRLLVRSRDGARSAVELTCTHRGCAIYLRRERLVCPCHGAAFALNGDVVQGPATTPLMNHPIALSEDGETLIIERG